MCGTLRQRLDSINAHVSPPTAFSQTFSQPPISPSLPTTAVESQSAHRSTQPDEFGRTTAVFPPEGSSAELKSTSERDEERARRVRTLGNSTRLDRSATASPQSTRGDRSPASTRIRQSAVETPQSLRRITSRRDDRLPPPPSSNTSSSNKLSPTIRSRPSLPSFSNDSPVASPLLSPRTNSPSGGSVRSSYTTTATTVRSARERTKTPDSSSARRWASQVEHSYSNHDDLSTSQRAITPKADRTKKSSAGSGTGSGSGGGSTGQIGRYDSPARRRESDISERSEEDRSLSRSGSAARLRTSSLQTDRELARVRREDRDDGALFVPLFTIWLDDFSRDSISKWIATTRRSTRTLQHHVNSSDHHTERTTNDRRTLATKL